MKAVELAETRKFTAGEVLQNTGATGKEGRGGWWRWLRCEEGSPVLPFIGVGVEERRRSRAASWRRRFMARGLSGEIVREGGEEWA